MKPLLILVPACILCGCAVDTPPAEEVREHFEQGLPPPSQLVPGDRPEEAIPPGGRPH
ncbi:MAG: hypothetical protein ACREIF_06720 [Chthoniobacterales bacterium]